MNCLQPADLAALPESVDEIHLLQQWCPQAPARQVHVMLDPRLPSG